MKTEEEVQKERQAKMLLVYIGILGCLLLACGMWAIFGLGWFLITLGLAFLLCSLVCIIGFAIADWNDEIKEKSK